MKPLEKVDINTAVGKHLTGLPGVTIDIARRIVAYRKRHGGLIHDWGELLNVNGFPADRMEEIKARAVLGTAERKTPTEPSLIHHFPGQQSRKVNRKS